jgi:hypothetical protein
VREPAIGGRAAPAFVEEEHWLMSRADGVENA